MKRIATVVPALAWMGFIFWLSSLPGNTLQETVTDNALTSFSEILTGAGSFLVHVSLFFVLGVMVLFAAIRGWRMLPVVAAILAIAATLIYGTVDEVHQYFVPGRESSVQDVAGDVIGGILAAGSFLVLRKLPKLRLTVKDEAKIAAPNDES